MSLDLSFYLRRLIDLGEYSDVLATGLGDAIEVRTLAQFNLSDIARSSNPLGLLINMDKIVSALTAILQERPKDNAVRQEVDRHEVSGGTLGSWGATGKKSVRLLPFLCLILRN